MTNLRTAVGVLLALLGARSDSECLRVLQQVILIPTSPVVMIDVAGRRRPNRAATVTDAYACCGVPSRL